MANTVVELEGELLKRRYLLYVVELSYKGNQYFYVGQTGDTRVITARPVFRRLAAHLEDRKSTQNQLYQYVAHDILGIPGDEGKKIAFTEESRRAVEECLTKSKIKMYAYHLEDFLPKTTPESHKGKRRKTQKIEEQVIDIFRKNGRRLMNKKTPSASYDECPYPEVLKQVALDFNLAK